MLVIERTFLFISWVVIAAIVAVIVIMVLRMISDGANLNPFAFTSRTIRRLSDPFISPARRALMGFGVDPKYTPAVVILIVILLGWFMMQLADTIRFTLVGLILSILNAAPVRAIGFVLYGLLSLYSLMILVRIIFPGVALVLKPANAVLVNATERCLSIAAYDSPLGMMDISPIIVSYLIAVTKRYEHTLARRNGAVAVNQLTR
jgi:uncharacterized protein YggT (Ycf19 family)